MDQHQIKKNNYQRLEELRKINCLFRSCVHLLKMEKDFPLDQIYSEEKMKTFITENFDTVINSALDTHDLPRLVAGPVARERKKALIRQKEQCNFK